VAGDQLPPRIDQKWNIEAKISMLCTIYPDLFLVVTPRILRIKPKRT